MVSAIKNEIYIGSLINPMYYFDNDSIHSAPVTQSVALVGQELSIDTFLPVVSDTSLRRFNIIHFRSSDGKEIETGTGQIYAVNVTDNPSAPSMLDIPDETPVWYYHNGNLVGKFYVMDVIRQAKNKYQLKCVSAIGLLDTKYHGGGLFQATTFGDVLQDILASGLWGNGNPVISYEIDDDLAELPVSGWLPHASKRNNLYQLMFANGVNIIKNIDGNPRFTFVYKPPLNAGEIIDDNIYYGGSVEYTKPYSQVEVIEHTYAALIDVERVTLLDHTEGTPYYNTQVWFENAPVIVSTIEASAGLTMTFIDENGAIVSGNGTITGIPYTHTARTVKRSNLFATEEKTVSVTDCTMVNLINSENLVNRLYAFYCPSTLIKLVKNSIKYTNERCGKAYLLHNPYGEQVTAFLSHMDADATSIIKADCEFYAGYEPAGQEGLYQHVDILIPTEDPETGELIYEGDWELPEDVTQIKVIMISGGTGGSSGYPGENGEDTETYTEVEQTADLSAVWYGAEGGKGGAGGPGGVPGHVKVIVIDNPESSYHYELGQGGEGGDPTDQLSDGDDPDLVVPNVGDPGTETTFGEYSTADQDSFLPVGGVYEQITDHFYALSGKNGISGGHGGARKEQKGDNFIWVTDGESVTDEQGIVYQGGITGSILTEVTGLPEAKIKAYGGNGAGAAIGLHQKDYSSMNGGNDQSAIWEVLEDT